MINKFSQFLVEEEKVVYFTFGRMNPPTIGHGKLLDVLAAKSGRNPYKGFCLSHKILKRIHYLILIRSNLFVRCFLNMLVIL